MPSRSVPSMVPGKAGFDILADLILHAMKRRDITTSALAESSGVSRVILSAWLNGRRPMRADYLAAVMKALDLTVTSKV